MNLNILKNNTSNSFLVQGLIWCFFIIASLVQFYEAPYNISSDFFVQWASGIIVFYFNYIYCVPQLLLQKKYGTYFLYLIAIIGFFMIIRTLYFIPEFKMDLPIRNNGSSNFPPINQNLNPRLKPRNRPFFLKFFPSLFYIFLTAISTIIKILSEYYSNQQNKLIAEAQKNASDLIYLRKQTNPHFLFNSLNSIYSLAHKKSDLVPDAIVTLSELMRYMLYETDNKYVFLENEINYIKNYIALQKLRLNNIENIMINVHGDTKNKFIEPLLLISFIENAFKYGTDYKGAAYVKIRISIVDNDLDFFVENKVEKITIDPKNSGIGLSNIESRLKLLYPNSHKLTISETGNKYTVHLSLHLDKIQN